MKAGEGLISKGLAEPLSEFKIPKSKIKCHLPGAMYPAPKETTSKHPGTPNTRFLLLQLKPLSNSLTKLVKNASELSRRITQQADY